ncbi:MAG: hypothetical protein H3C38_03140 [Rhodospirillales bacterium]|nr:hypothetical protein [Rhodospirillales bacterium]
MLLRAATSALLALAFAASCAAPQDPAPGYRLGLYAMDPDPFNDVIGADDDIGLEGDFAGSGR